MYWQRPVYHVGHSFGCCVQPPSMTRPSIRLTPSAMAVRRASRGLAACLGGIMSRTIGHYDTEWTLTDSARSRRGVFHWLETDAPPCGDSRTSKRPDQWRSDSSSMPSPLRRSHQGIRARSRRAASSARAPGGLPGGLADPVCHPARQLLPAEASPGAGRACHRIGGVPQPVWKSPPTTPGCACAPTMRFAASTGPGRLVSWRARAAWSRTVPKAKGGENLRERTQRWNQPRLLTGVRIDTEASSGPVHAQTGVTTVPAGNWRSSSARRVTVLMPART